MPQASVFHWIDGNGLLILAPGTPGSSDIRAQAIGRAPSGGALVCAMVNGLGDSSDALLDDLEQLGAPAGYLVDLVTEDDETIEQALREASIIVIESGRDVQSARSALLGAAQRGIRTAYEQGAVVLAEGNSAVLFGKWMLAENAAVLDGFGWISEAVIVGVQGELSEQVKPLLAEHPHGYAVGITGNTALALGPGAQVSVWGDQQVAITLGTQYGQSA